MNSNLTNLANLAQAHGRMPYLARHHTGTGMVLTLLFWHMASLLWQRGSKPGPDAGGMPDATPPSQPIIMSDEANRIDETLISAFQKIGVALPDSAPPAG